MSADRNKPNPNDPYPYNVLGEGDIKKAGQIFAPRGDGYVVLGNISDSISACSKANGAAYVNESTAAITNLAMYYCGGVQGKDGVIAIYDSYQTLPKETSSDGTRTWYLLHHQYTSAAIAQHLDGKRL